MLSYICNMYATYLHNNKMILYDNALYIINMYVYPYVPSQKTIPEPGLRENYIKYIITIEIKIDKCF